MKKDVCSPLVRRMYDIEIEDVTKTELEGEWTSDRLVSTTFLVYFTDNLRR